MPWFRRDKGPKRVRTEGLWIKCDSCSAPIWKKDLEAHGMVCSECGFHFKIGARQRLEMLFDEASWEECGGDLKSSDALRFTDRKSYEDRLEDAARKTGLHDAVICGCGKLGGPQRGDLRHGVPLHRRQHGGCCGREAHSRGRARAGQAPPSDHRLGFRAGHA